MGGRENSSQVIFQNKIQSASLQLSFVELRNLFLVQVSSLDVDYKADVEKINSFMEQCIPLTFPGQIKPHSSLVSSLQRSRKYHGIKFSFFARSSLSR